MKEFSAFITRGQKLKRFIIKNYSGILIWIISFIIYFAILPGFIFKNYFNYPLLLFFVILIILAYFYKDLLKKKKVLSFPFSLFFIILSHLSGGIYGELKGIPYYIFFIVIEKTSFRIFFFFIFLTAEIIPPLLKHNLSYPPLILFILVSSFLINFLYLIENSIREKDIKIDELSSKLRFFNGLKLRKEEVFKGLKETPLPREPYALLKRALNYFTEIYFLIYSPQTLIFLFYDRSRSGFRFEAGNSRVYQFSDSYLIFESSPLISLGIKQKKTLFLSEAGTDGKNLGIYEKEGVYVGSCILTPIIYEGNLYGFIYMDSDKINYFPQSVLEVMEKLSKKVSIMLKFFFELKENKINSERYRALFELAKETAGHLEKKEIFSKVFSICNNIFEFDIFIFSQKVKDDIAEISFIYDPKELVREKTINLAEDSLFSFAYQNDYPLILKRIRREIPVINRENYGIRSACFAPIRIENNIKYIFALFSFFSENFTEKDKEIVDFLKNQCEIVLEKAEIYERERERAMKDSLTGLYNHRMFQEMLERRIQKGMPFTLLMIDVDDFKKLNDFHGHPAGDKILVEIAKILEGETKNIGFSARYGGEEFALCLDLPKYEGARKAEEIRKIIEEWDFYIDEEKKLNITISIGIAGFPQDAKRRAELIEKADKALYLAKRKGKNRVYIYEIEETGLF